MKIRRLQRLDENQQWQDHGYAYELETGQCTFRFNPLVWGGTGSRLSERLYESNTPLTTIETIIPAQETLRWLEIEVLEGENGALKAMLDQQCGIPHPEQINIAKSAAA